MSKKKATKSAAAVEDKPEPSHHHYEGKQVYPKVLYGKNKKGEVVSQTVKDADAHLKLAKEYPGYGWASSPADHDVETAPAATPLAPTKL